ncbi:MAG: GIDE domain-containing protein [Desulfobacteraceae bacterium]|nr:GIDE domain-containing protein [Desulfobacteraceae bacterium]
MTPATTCPAASVSSDGHDTRMGFILYHRYRRIPENIQESLTEAAAATGINVSELRMRLTGTGIGALTVNRPLKELERCADDLKSIGLPAAVIEKDLIKKSRLPAAAKKLHLSAASMAFEDANGETLFQINDQTDLLIIITDLSGQSVRQRMTAMTYTGTAVNSSFEESLKKISIARPAAIFYALNNPSVTGVYVDADIFSFMGLNEHLTCAKGTNFRVMINQAMALAKSCVMDENFGLSLLPGASPEWNSDKPAIEKELGRYARYIIAAAGNKLLVKGSEIPGQEIINKGLDQEGPETDDTTINNGNSASTEKLKSPPDISASRLVTFFQTSMPEIIAVMIVSISPFSLLMSGVRSIHHHHRLWEAAAGASIALAGSLMFVYALLMLYYRRIVENTPTSKIRSLSMGMVELSGKTRRYFDLKTSATLTPCVFYQCRHYKYTKTGDSSRWALTRSVSSGKISFYIEDGTGRVLVNPKGAIFKIPLTTQTFSGSFIPSLSLQLSDPDTKVVEDLIPVGVRVYVLGSAQIERHGLDTRTRIIDKLRQLKQNPESLNRYDANGDGQIDGNEWEAARQDAATQVYAESLTDASANAETVVIEKPRFGLLPFIVADSEKGLVRQLMFRTVLFLAAGIITIGFSIRFMASLLG